MQDAASLSNRSVSLLEERGTFWVRREPGVPAPLLLKVPLCHLPHPGPRESAAPPQGAWAGRRIGRKRACAVIRPPSQLASLQLWARGFPAENRTVAALLRAVKPRPKGLSSS